MSQSQQQRKADVLAEILSEVRERVPANDADAVARFTERFYHHVSFEDLAGRTASNLYGAALSLWQLGARRPAGKPRIRVLNPHIDEHGWACPHTVIQVVNDDMPFIVDSVVNELNRRDLLVHLTIHPIVSVLRGAEGEWLGLGEAGEQGAVQESFLHIEIEEQADSAIPEIEACIAGILHDVRLAVDDWRNVVDRMRESIRDLESDPPPLDPGHVAEAKSFLEWMVDNHFTFLGCRDYDLVTENGAQYVRLREDSGLGILREVSEESRARHSTPLAEAEREFANRKEVLIIRKAYDRATVHRPVHMDYIGIRLFDGAGNVTGERRFLGLFTSSAYRERPSVIPMIRQKMGRIMARAGFSPNSHDGKALEHVLESYPRDELMQADEETLYEAAIRLLRLEERPRVAFFLRPDPFQRFLSCLIYVPRDHYATAIRHRFQEILESELNATCSAFQTEVGDGPLARIHFALSTEPGRIPDIDPDAIEAKLAEAATRWTDKLKEALVARNGEEEGLALWRRYRYAVPTSYSENVPAEFATLDIDQVEATLRTMNLRTSLYQKLGAKGTNWGLKLFFPGVPMTLSDVIPMLENAGLKVLSEIPYEISLNEGATKVWIHDFVVSWTSEAELDVHDVRDKFDHLLKRIWNRQVEDDGFNRLVLRAGLTWREVVYFRTCCKYLRQTGITFSEPYMQDTLDRNPNVVVLLSELIRTLFNLEDDGHRHVRAVELNVRIEEALEQVANLDEDRILRRFHNFFRSVLRTNIFQESEGRPADDEITPDPELRFKEYVSFKIDSEEVDDLPLPRPRYEIFVYSPRVEGIHLRGGKVARGGLRWSDRREDFRTEILGLMKAQMVKNAVIVPVGSKGGFVVKRPPAEGGREALMEEVIACYKTFISGLLDLTDNLKEGSVVAPAGVLRHDDDDPYLVVAADKGTATFSDIANGVSRDYGFWLDDAFASGGSAGYDHKKMGITARGAWESVKRHFREMGKDIQSEDFTVIGVGDMSGDVFGNGMLLSRHIKLIGAFNHQHIFIDPDPDPEAGFRERERLFKEPRSSWADYDRSLISNGGGIFERSAKSVTLTPEIKALFGAKSDKMTPAELIRTMLTAETELLWFGGIGTYVKAMTESQAEADDRANDALRVDAADVRAQVIGEGANLGVTQRGRIEYALGGGRLNTDAIDNSAGVDCSDHEVNIKIALRGVLEAGDMTMKQRDRLLEEMTDEVAALVLRDNYLQTQALSVEQARGTDALDEHVALIRWLERSGRLNRQIEFLPDDEKLTERQVQGQGLTRPELAVLLGYAKIALYDGLLPSDLPDDELLEGDLIKYFPTQMAEGHTQALLDHRLRREIIATRATNSLVNRAGPGFVTRMAERTGLDLPEIVRAYAVTRDVFDLRRLWEEIEALDNRVAAGMQTDMLIAIADLIQRCSLWFLLNLPHPIDTAAVTAEYGAGIRILADEIGNLVAERDRTSLSEAAAPLTAAGVPDDLAWTVASFDLLASGCDVVKIASTEGLEVSGVARTYFGAGTRFGFDRLRGFARGVATESRWDKQAVDAMLDDLYANQSALTMRILETAGGIENVDVMIEAWGAARTHAIKRLEAILHELETAPAVDIAMLAVANRQVRALVNA
ncbi:MAG: NAD-glutamate dehydrogenase [Alphaproteobacteria bacterium]